MSNITLSAGQQEAMDSFVQFILNPDETMFVLQGYAGTGKSTLVKHLIDTVPSILKSLNFINPDQINYSIEVSATTNKAAEVLELMLGTPVSTIHSLLGLTVHNDVVNHKTSLIDRQKKELYKTLLFIDEASFIDKELLRFILDKTRIKCKVVFIGDPAQLTPVKCSVAPIFLAGFPTASLTEVLRQVSGNPIIDLATRFRNTVNTGEFFNFKPDGVAIKHLNREAFQAEILQEFLDPTWTYNRSKILGWTNKCVQWYNQLLREKDKGSAHVDKGDYCTVNKYISGNRWSFSTDQVVYISNVIRDTEIFGIKGRDIEINNGPVVFMPNDWPTAKKHISLWRQQGEYTKVMASEKWIDLRSTYACTVNKSQGSTYDKVYIDLSDISRCNNANQIARMLYVAVSRARSNVVFTGDFV